MFPCMSKFSARWIQKYSSWWYRSWSFTTIMEFPSIVVKKTGLSHTWNWYIEVFHGKHNMRMKAVVVFSTSCFVAALKSLSPPCLLQSHILLSCFLNSAVLKLSIRQAGVGFVWRFLVGPSRCYPGSSSSEQLCSLGRALLSEMSFTALKAELGISGKPFVFRQLSNGRINS